MAREILGEFGDDSSQPQAGVAGNGGVMPVRDVRNYCPPQGPSNIGDSKSPGLHGTNYGMARCPDARGGARGSPGIGGGNSGVGGTQGKR